MTNVTVHFTDGDTLEIKNVVESKMSYHSSYKSGAASHRALYVKDNEGREYIISLYNVKYYVEVPQ